MDYWAPFLQGLSYLESNNNPNAANSTSSAKGGFQFINGTAQQAINAGIPNPQYGDLNQQTAATQSFIRKFLPKTAAALDSGDINTAIATARNTWPSLPGGSQPQSAARYAQFNKILGGNVSMPDIPSMPSLPGLDPQLQLQLLRSYGMSGQQPYNPVTSDWGSALQQAGAALAAASNPQAAYALTSLANQNRSNQTEQQKVMQSGLLALAQLKQAAALKQYEESQQNYRLGASETAQNARAQAALDQEKMLKQMEVGAVQGPLGAQFYQKLQTPDQMQKQQSSGTDLERVVNNIADARKTNPDLPPEEALKLVPPVYQGVVKAVVDGREPGQQYGKNPQFRTAVDVLTQAVEPATDQNAFNWRRTLFNDFAHSAPNTMGGQASALDTLAKHGAELRDNYAQLYAKHPDLAGRNILFWNNATNKWDTQLGYPEALAIRDNANAYSTEKDRYLTGKPTTDEGRREQGALFTDINSPSQATTLLGTDARLFKDRKGALEARILALTHGKFPSNMDLGKGIITPEGMKALDDLDAAAPRYGTPGNPTLGSPGATDNRPSLGSFMSK